MRELGQKLDASATGLSKWVHRGCPDLDGEVLAELLGLASGGLGYCCSGNMAH